MLVSWWIMQPGNIGQRIARHISRGFMHISWETSSCWARALRLSNCRGAFFTGPGVRFVPSRAKEGRKEGRAGTSAKSPKRQQRKLDRGTVDGSLFSPKRLHRRREPSPVLFQHFAALFYLTPRPTLLCDWIIQIPFSVLSRLPALVANRAPTPPFAPPPRLSGDFHPLAISHRVFRLAAAVYTWCHMPSKRPSNSARVHRSSDKCRSCDSATSGRYRSEWARLSENRCSRMHCVKSSINFC